MSATRSRTSLGSWLRPALAGALLSFGLAASQAGELKTATLFRATPSTRDYSVLHDRATNLVFVKLPQGWVFVGADEHKRRHAVYLDDPTGFVFVKLSDGWKFAGTSADPAIFAEAPGSSDTPAVSPPAAGRSDPGS